MSFITRIFKQPSANMPPPPVGAPPAAPPTIDQGMAQQDREDQLLRRRGSASTILVPGMATMSGSTGGASQTLGG